MAQPQQNDAMQQPLPDLPTELWLDILEHTVTPNNADFLWRTVRRVSRHFKAHVELIFKTKYLPFLTISLVLPLRRAAKWALIWRGPGRQVKMAYRELKPDGQTVVIASPTILRDNSTRKSAKELRCSSVLMKERLQTARPWVNLSRAPLLGCAVDVPVCVDWDEGQKVWVWELRWMELVSKLCKAKQKRNDNLIRNARPPM
jgi:hypothetical protein